MPDTGRAVVLEAFGADCVVREYPVPDPEPGALVVRIDAATVCGSDVHAWEGHLGVTAGFPLPTVPGHEMVGSVVAIGDGADRDSIGQALRPGDRVVWANAACNHCQLCNVDRMPTLCPDRTFVGIGFADRPPHFVGAFAEYGYVLPESGRLRVPDAVHSEWASAASCALRTVVNVVQRAGRVDYLDSVVVQGAGPLGLFTTAVLATHGPRHLIVVGGPDERLELAREWGATHTVSIDEHHDAAGRLEAVRSITGAPGPHVVFEVSGAPGAAGEGINMLRKNGRYVVAGTVGGGLQPIDVGKIVTGSLTVLGSMSGGIDSYFKAMEFLSGHRDRYDWDRMLGRRYGLQT